VSDGVVFNASQYKVEPMNLMSPLESLEVQFG
jgi:hypothetical protein